ncbi:MAG: 30S ribosome-binding factor RbfA [Acidobacteria bacterium]|nr:30S ribosome-binding factor RbfA [Acidobacteriota bacterium]
MAGRRTERLSEQIREEVSLIIDGELTDPRIGLATITEARITPDLSHAKIFVSVTGSDEEIKATLTALNHAAGFIRLQLGYALRVRRTPELHFVHDDTVRAAERIEQILHEEEEKVKAKASGEETSEPTNSVAHPSEKIE